MSLFIGNLSAHTRGDDLLHVFRRFGKCTIRLKDRYGFVDFDFPQDAENALRALQGRKICGESLVLKCSKQRPTPLARYQRSARSDESLHERRSARGREYASEKLSSTDRRGYRSNADQPESDGKELNSVDMLYEGRHDPVKAITNDSKEHLDLREGLMVDGGGDVAKQVDSGRCVGEDPDPSDAVKSDNEVKFDRYEPCQDGREDEYEKQQMAYSGGGSASHRLQEYVSKEKTSDTTLNHSNNLKSQITCFSCGDVGHKIRDCTRKYSSERKLTRFDYRQDNVIGKSSRGDEEGFESMSLGKLQSIKEYASSRLKNNSTSDSGKTQRLINNGRFHTTARTENDRTELKDRGGKKRSRWEGKLSKWDSAKKARSVSSSPDSDNPAFKSRTAFRLSKYTSRCNSRTMSRSVSVRAQSLSSDSASSPKSISPKSKSRSRSSSSFESLSPSSLNLKAHVNLESAVQKTKTSISKEILLDNRQRNGGHELDEIADHEGTVDVVNYNNAGLDFELDGDMKSDQSLQRDHHENHNTAMPIYEDENLSKPLANIGVQAAENSSPEGPKDEKDPRYSGALVMGPTQLKEPASENLVNYCPVRSTCVSSEEMCRVLKHYGMELPGEGERHLVMEDYLGSARLWPWEIIYYRRLKKGLISVENYARRVSQNKEFGIIDKYVRSSSGWGEIDQENP